MAENVNKIAEKLWGADGESCGKLYRAAGKWDVSALSEILSSLGLTVSDDAGRQKLISLALSFRQTSSPGRKSEIAHQIANMILDPLDSVEGPILAVPDDAGRLAKARELLREADALGALIKLSNCDISLSYPDREGRGTWFRSHIPPDQARLIEQALDLVVKAINTPQPAPVAAQEAAAQQPAPNASFQDRVGEWIVKCFGDEIAKDRTERCHRFIEEALELVQACGTTRSECLQLVDYVFNRPSGNVCQEIGGVTVTLAAMCQARGVDMMACAESELKRIWLKIDKIREKQANKPKHSPLPQHPTFSIPKLNHVKVVDHLIKQRDAAYAAGTDAALASVQSRIDVLTRERDEAVKARAELLGKVEGVRATIQKRLADASDDRAFHKRAGNNTGPEDGKIRAFMACLADIAAAFPADGSKP